MSETWKERRRETILEVGLTPRDHVGLFKWGARYGIELAVFRYRSSYGEPWRLTECTLIGQHRHATPFSHRQLAEEPEWLARLKEVALLKVTTDIPAG